MRLFSLLVLLVPALARAQGLPVLADFDDGQLRALGGALLSQQARLSLVEAGDYTTQGGSLRVQSLADDCQVSLPLAPEGLQLGRLSSSRSIIVDWKAEQAGTLCRICLEGGTVAGTLCSTLKATDNAWHESSLPLPPSQYGLAFRSRSPQAEHLKASTLTLQPQSGSAWQFDELRLDPPASTLSADAVAAAFGSTPAQVRAARRLGLPELATWTLLLLSERSGLSPQALAAERSTRSWGEIAQAHGWAWGDLMDEVARRQAQAGLRAPEASQFQERKLMDNHAFEGVRP